MWDPLQKRVEVALRLAEERAKPMPDRVVVVACETALRVIDHDLGRRTRHGEG